MLSPQDPLHVPFAQADGLFVQRTAWPEPGQVVDGTLGAGDTATARYGQVVQITDVQLGGSDPSTGTWRVTVTPTVGPIGGAGARGMAPAYVEFEATADTLADVVQGLIDAAEDAATITSPATAATYSRLWSYVLLAVSPVNTAHLRATGRTEGEEFEIEVTPPAGNTATNATIQGAETAQIIVGGYCAIDRTKGQNGFALDGGMHVIAVSSSTDPDDLVGPVALSNEVEATQRGDLYRYYLPCAVFPVFKTQQAAFSAYAEGAIAASSFDSAVYVRHTSSGAKKAGMVGDLADAAAGATRAVWTGTPTAVNSTEYIFQVIGLTGKLVELTVLSDGSATATEICNSARVEINKHTSVGGALYGITASGTSTIVLTGPTDGREFTPSQVAASAGTIAWVHTTTGVTTHHLLSRADKFAGVSTAAGAVPVRLGAPL